VWWARLECSRIRSGAYNGRIYAALRRRGKPIPANDMWIAAHAMETGAELLSSDTHFQYVEGLAWTDPGKP